MLHQSSSFLTFWKRDGRERTATVIAGCEDALLSEMRLPLWHLSGLDRNNPRPNSRGCNLEICAGTETESA